MYHDQVGGRPGAGLALTSSRGGAVLDRLRGADLAALMPPALNPGGFFFLRSHAVKRFPPALTGLLAGRPLTFPPVVVFGANLEAMKLVVFNPNSRAAVRDEDPRPAARPSRR